MHDYLRAITNTHHSDSSWTLDPRVNIPDSIIKQGAERGIGNQVSSEFNLLYRFHPAISQRDEKWTERFLGDMFDGKDLDQVDLRDFGMAVMKFDAAIPDDPAERGFQKYDKVRRGSNGKFNDADLVRILRESMDDPAGG